jgi:hypothetical protein
MLPILETPEYDSEDHDSEEDEEERKSEDGPNGFPLCPSPDDCWFCRHAVQIEFLMKDPPCSTGLLGKTVEDVVTVIEDVEELAETGLGCLGSLRRLLCFAF